MVPRFDSDVCGVRRDVDLDFSGVVASNSQRWIGWQARQARNFHANGPSVAYCSRTGQIEENKQQRACVAIPLDVTLAVEILELVQVDAGDI